jgi:HD-GYP domain-containing protein (c-di-GMP phosphodiesterase class II)
MLAIPMRNADGRVRGVLQLINKLRDGTPSAAPGKAPHPDDIVPFGDEDQALMEAFASQASVAIENAKLTENIENLFESFIRASVTAIESRDPATSGHSDRVAVLTVEFARAVHQMASGPFQDAVFSEEQIRELRYAALLHDFGKIGVREAVLQKRNKLYPHEMETILLRLDSARARHEMKVWKDMASEIVADLVASQTSEAGKSKLLLAANKIDSFAQQLQQVRLSIIKANQPQIVGDDFDIAALMSWINRASRDLEQMILTPEEIVKLSLPKGTLGEDERREIESHVTHTYHFLRQIAWTEDLSQVPEIAYGHHEKSDGSGYPRGLTAEHILIQSKMMAISDIYDALTSMDRPYKKAATAERAIEILHLEARSGKLDLDLLKVFVEGDVYRSIEGMANRKAA